MRYPLFLCLVGVSLSPAMAAPEGQTGRAGLNNDPNQVVCRVERETGSRLRANRVCRTRAQWDEYQRQMRRALERAQNEMQTHGQ